MACPRFTDEALLESRYVCTVKYRTHPSHEMLSVGIKGAPVGGMLSCKILEIV
jgi:hypothetical protein